MMTQMNNEEKKKPVPFIAGPRYLEEFLMRLVLDEFFIAWNKDEGIRDGWVHASSVLQGEGEFCFREHVLAVNYKGQTKELPVETLKKFLHGWLLHEKWQDVLKKEVSLDEQNRWQEAFFEAYQSLQEDPLFNDVFSDVHDDLVLTEKWKWLFMKYGALADEVEQTHIEKQYDLSFTPDLLLKVVVPRFITTIEGTQYVMEIKGYREEAFQHIKKLHRKGEEMKDAEFRKAAIQANLYMHLLNVPNAIVLIECKNTQEFLLSIRSYEEEMALPYVARLTKLKRYTIANKELGKFPVRVCQSVDDKRAKNCPMRVACFSSLEERERYRK